MNTRQQQLQAFNRLLDIMDDLREKCPWDKKQTLESLRHLTIEETYELGDAILDNDLEEIKKLHLFEFGIFIDLYLDIEEKAKLEADLSVEIANGTLSFADKYKILSIPNFKYFFNSSFVSAVSIPSQIYSHPF